MTSLYTPVTEKLAGLRLGLLVVSLLFFGLGVFHLYGDDQRLALTSWCLALAVASIRRVLPDKRSHFAKMEEWYTRTGILYQDHLNRLNRLTARGGRVDDYFLATRMYLDEATAVAKELNLEKEMWGSEGVNPASK